MLANDIELKKNRHAHNGAHTSSAYLFTISTITRTWIDRSIKINKSNKWYLYVLVRTQYIHIQCAQSKLAAVMFFSVGPKSTRSTFQTLHPIYIVFFSTYECKFFSFVFLWRRTLIAVIIHSLYNIYVSQRLRILRWHTWAVYRCQFEKNICCRNSAKNGIVWQKCSKIREKRITGTHRISLDDLSFYSVNGTLRNVLRSIETQNLLNH